MQSRGRRLFKPNAKDAEEKGHLYDVDENGGIIVSVGAELRQARLSAGFELQEVSNSLRIRRAHLEALEEERYGDLPGAPYAVGFVRSYAKFLGLDGDTVVARFKDEANNADRLPKLDFPAPTDEGRMPKTWLIVVALVLAGVAYGGWQYFSNRDDSEARRSADVPENLASLATETPEASAPDIMPAPADDSMMDGSPEPAATPVSAAEPTVEPAEAAMSSESSSFGVTAEELLPPGAPAVEPDALVVEPETDIAAEVSAAITAPAGEEWTENEIASYVPAGPVTASMEPSVETPGAAAGDDPEAAASVGIDLSSVEPNAPIHEPRVYGGENLEARIVIRATGDSWVQIQGLENELLLTRILHQGDSYRVPDRPGILMITGNAGALEIWLDDEPLPVLGPPGLVLRDVALEPDALRATAADE